MNDDNVILQSDGFQGDRNDHDTDKEQVSDSMMLITSETDTIPFVAYCNEHWKSYGEISSSSTSSLINIEAPIYLTDSNIVDNYHSHGIIVTGLYKLVSNSTV